MTPHRTQYAAFLFLLGLFLSGTATAQIINNCTGNESWLQMGAGISGEAITSTEMNGQLYVLYIPIEQNKHTITYRISRWDGSAWHAVAGLELPPRERQNNYTLSLQGYNGELYLGGDFAALNYDFNLGYIAKWNGSAWVSAEANIQFGPVRIFELHDGDLYAWAMIERNGEFGWHVVRWNGTVWDAVGPDSPSLEEAGYITALKSWNGALYAGGTNVLRWDGTDWAPLGTAPPGLQGSVQKFAVYRDQLYIWSIFSSDDRGRNGLARWNGTTWDRDFPMPSIYLPMIKMAVHNDQLYVLSMNENNTICSMFGYTRIDRFDGTAWHEVSNTNGLLSFIEQYNGELYIGGIFSESCGSPLSNIARLCDAVACGKISGTIFHDIDSDCAQGQKEQGLPRWAVKISPGGYVAVTDEQGNYSLHVTPGTYTVSLAPYLSWNQTCPAASGSHTVTVAAAGSMNNGDFGTLPVTYIRDLRVSMVTNRFRQGEPMVYAITYENVGTMAMNGTVRFTYDPILVYSSAQDTPTRRLSGAAEWDFTDLKIGESRTIHLWATAPATIPTGTDICSQVEISPRTNNALDADNRDSVCTTVTGSYTLNEMRVTPFGRANDGIITSGDSVLTYWVRFQNTGNDTVFKVVVIDTLSSHLDIASIRLGAASHPYSFTIDKSNALIWTFNDIMLPDSNASEANSHGFFKFSVKLKRDLPPLTEIANQAHIYFDYNAPVPTNTVVSILGASMGVDRPAVANALAIYPNPAREQITINAQLRAGGTLEVRNLLGETLKSYRHDGSETVSIDLRDLPAGSYLVTAETLQGVQSQRITVVR